MSPSADGLRDAGRYVRGSLWYITVVGPLEVSDMYPRPIVRTAVLVIGMVYPAGASTLATQSGETRPAYCAGSWYPGDPAELAKEIDELLVKDSPPTLPGAPMAIIAPHAGYRFSAPVAVAAYRCLKGGHYRRVIVLAFSHRAAGAYDGVDVPGDLTAYGTPLGEVPIDRDACDRLLQEGPFTVHPGVDRGEHSLELQLPFLQRAIGAFRLVPLYVGRMSADDYARAAHAILPLLDGETLLVASSDFTHYGRNYGYEPFSDDVPRRLKELADHAAAPILRCDFDGFSDHLANKNDTICGRGPIALLLRILSMQGGADGVRTALDTSGNITGDWSNSVTYQSFVFTPRRGAFGDAERAALLRIARQTVTAYLKGEEPPRPDPDQPPAAARADGACFVTLTNHGRLRGCIGNMAATGPIYQAVIHNAVAACQDQRFVLDPVTAAELDQIHIEISALTPMKRVTDTGNIVIGRDGLLIGMGPRRGVLLPQVAYERGWTRQEFLAQTCRKAGLPPDAWKQSAAEIYSFQAEVFSEPE